MKKDTFVADGASPFVGGITTFIGWNRLQAILVRDGVLRADEQLERIVATDNGLQLYIKKVVPPTR